MPQVRVLTKGARVTGGVFSLLFALHTLLWIVRDVAELGAGALWDVWTGAAPVGTSSALELPATSTLDLGLLLLQLAATFAAFTGAWTAGGLLACSTVHTFAYRLPVLWHVVLHDEGEPVFLDRSFDTEGAGYVAAGTSLVVAILSFALALILLAGLKPWAPAQQQPQGPWGAGAPGQAPPFGPPQPYMIQPPQTPPFAEPPLPSEMPQRPVGAHVAAAAVFFGLEVLFNIGWNIHMLSELGIGIWSRSFIGVAGLQAILGISAVWIWLTIMAVSGVAGLLAITRGLSARGFTTGAALIGMPPALLGLWAQLSSGLLTRAGTPAISYFNVLYQVILLVGGAVLLVLAMRPGVPAQPGAPVHGGAPWPQGAPMQQGAPFGAGPAPYGAPQQHPGQPQPYGPPQPPAGAPPQPYGPPPGAPPQPAGPPPGTPPQPAGPPPGAPPQPSGPPLQKDPEPPGGSFGPPPSAPPAK
ncbi:hypothetical protein [Streptomyces daqingensis]|nr:hypothetical protein [Streptomyces daqingensis]